MSLGTGRLARWWATDVRRVQAIIESLRGTDTSDVDVLVDFEGEAVHVA